MFLYCERSQKRAGPRTRRGPRSVRDPPYTQRHRLVTTAAAIALGAGTLAACGSGSGTVRRIGSGLADVQGAGQEGPDHRQVKKQASGDTLVTKILTAHKAGKAPDPVQAEYQALPTLVSNDALADISENAPPTTPASSRASPSRPAPSGGRRAASSGRSVSTTRRPGRSTSCCRTSCSATTRSSDHARPVHVAGAGRQHPRAVHPGDRGACWRCSRWSPCSWSSSGSGAWICSREP